MDRPLRKDALERRRALLNAAAEVLAEHGFDAPLELVVERAGVGRATLYRNFPDRTRLVLAVLNQQIDDVEEWVRGRGDAPEAFVAFIEDIAQLTARNAGFPAALRAAAPDALIPIRARLTEIGAPLLARAQAVGQVRADLSAQDIPLITGLLSGALQGDREERQAMVERVLALVLDGLRARP